MGPLTRTQGWREPDFRGMDEAEVEEGLEEVVNNGYVTIVEGQDFMPVIVQIQRGHYACIVHCLIMIWRVV